MSPASAYLRTTCSDLCVEQMRDCARSQVVVWMCGVTRIPACGVQEHLHDHRGIDDDHPIADHRSSRVRCSAATTPSLGVTGFSRSSRAVISCGVGTDA